MVEATTNKKRNNRGGLQGLHPNSLKNLKPFELGKEGGPGRPKDPGLTPGQVKMLDEVCPFDAQGRTWRRYLQEKGLLQVAQSPGAMTDFKDRVEGKIPQPIVGEGGGPIRIHHDADGLIKRLEALIGVKDGP